MARGRSKPEQEDRGAFLPTRDQSKASAAKIREAWSPRQLVDRGGRFQQAEIPEYHSPDLSGAIQEMLGEAFRQA